MKHGSLFSGIGGFDLASQWMGWENKFHCEWNPFGQKVLKYYWPHAKSYTDITTTDFTIHRGEIDIITGGFPCQPFSAAGKRKGTEDSRYLWKEMLRAIREVQPSYVVAENVRGLTNWNGGMVFDQVQADLEAEGFEVLPLLLPACAVGAPHRRDRIWFVAYNANAGVESLQGREDGVFKSESFTDTTSVGRERGWNEKNCERENSGTEAKLFCDSERFGGEQNAPDTDSEGLQWSEQTGNKYSERAQSGNEQFNRLHRRTNWIDFPTQPPVCSRNDGLSARLSGITVSKHRKESLMAYGNAIVPQVALQIFKTIQTLTK